MTTTTKTMTKKTAAKKDESKRRIVRRNRKPAERAIIFAGLVGGLTIDETRELLDEAGFGGDGLPLRSWELLQQAYLPEFLKNPTLIGESIYAPKPMGDLKVL